MNLRICQLQESEAKELSEMINKVVDQMEKLNPDIDYQLVRNEDAPQELIKASKNGRMWVAKSAYKIVGTISLLGNRLRRFFVHPDYQRMGIGKALIKAATHYAKSKGLKEIHVGALLNAAPIYKKLGFIEDEIFLNPEINLKEMKMKLLL